jgi:hypothetical protein
LLFLHFEFNGEDVFALGGPVYLKIGTGATRFLRVKINCVLPSSGLGGHQPSLILLLREIELGRDLNTFSLSGIHVASKTEAAL